MGRHRHHKGREQGTRDEEIPSDLEDFRLASQLQATLLSLAPSTGLRVDVDADEGVVYLRGEVASWWQRERAEQIVRDTGLPGVREVRNELVVNPFLRRLFRP